MKRRDFLQSATALVALGTVGGFAHSCGKTNRPTKRELGKTGFMVFPVGYGGIVSMRDGQDASDNYVSWAIDHGVNFFDVAPSYGDAEEKMGSSLKSYRKDVYLACKTARRLRSEAEPEFEKSFGLLHTDYFDLYQMHNLSSQNDLDRAFGADGVLEMMVKAKQDGRVRKLGITAHSEEIALKAMAMYDFDSVMFPINWMMNKSNGMGSSLCNEAKKREMGVISIKSLIHRRWFEQSERDNSEYPKSWCKPIYATENKELGIAAVKYAFHLGANIVIPPGDFKSFSFVINNYDEIVNQPLSSNETKLLENEFSLVKEYPFF